MTNQDFILNIIKLYQKSRETSFYNKKIKRGRSRSISSSAEDLFALYLADKIDCDFIFVDQPISVIGHKSQFYPDIVVIKNNNII